MTEETEANIKRLLAQRRGHRGQLTKLLNKAENTPPAKDNDEFTLAGIVDSIQKKITVITSFDEQLIQLLPLTEIENAIIESDDYIEEMTAHFHALKGTLTVLTRVDAPAPIDVTNNDPNVSVSSADSHEKKRRVNLPKLQLPTFDGNVLKWTPFFDAYCAAINNDTNLDDIQKFQYLQSTLSGEAARTIEGLQLTNANYNEALSLLKDRYGQPHKLISGYMKALWELPQPGDSTTSIKDFYDKLESYVRGLKSLGKTEDSYGDLLVPIILEKLPGTLKKHIARDHGDKAWTIKELREAIYKEIQAAEAGNIENSNPSASSTAAAFHIKARTKHQPNASATSYGNKQQEQTVQTCVYCKGPHSAVQCKNVEKDKRYEMIKNDRRCFNCLRRNHTIQDCLSKGRCMTCRSKHHTSLCTKEYRTSDTKSSQSKNPEDTHVKLTPFGTHPTGPVLLKTASANLWHYNRGMTVNILLDEGAQRSFITEHTAEQLRVERSQCASEQVNLSTFGDKTPRSRQIDVAELELEDAAGRKLKLSALIVPRISTPVKNYVNTSVMNHQYLQDLRLAHHVSKDVFEIDLLIGADYYWTIVEDKVVRGPGPTAVASKLGYLLSGPTNLETNAVLNTMICKTLVDQTEDEHKLSTFWELETIGITDTDERTSRDDIDYQTYSDSLELVDGKYTARLPWKPDHAPLPTNFRVCEARTRSMVRRLSQDTRKMYQTIISDQLSRDFIETVEDDDRSCGINLLGSS